MSEPRIIVHSLSTMCVKCWHQQLSLILTEGIPPPAAQIWNFKNKFQVSATLREVALVARQQLIFLFF